MKSLIRPRRQIAVTAVAVLLLASAAPGRADSVTPLPEPCKPHPTQVVNPGCVPALTTNATAPVAGLPNLVPDVRQVVVFDPFVPGPQSGTWVPGGPHLGFDGWVQNVGDYPLELMADEPLDPTTAEQCVAWTATYVCREHRVVGGFVWHDEHGHYHFEDFADYQLRRLGADGRPDYSDAGLLARSEKVSFCLVDATLLDPLDPSPPLYTTCGPTRQGISPGWADVYSVGTPGQELPIRGLADGRYALVVAMDYPNRILETSDADNVLEVTVELSANGTKATIVDKHYP